MNMLMRTNAYHNFDIDENGKIYTFAMEIDRSRKMIYVDSIVYGDQIIEHQQSVSIQSKNNNDKGISINLVWDDTYDMYNSEFNNVLVHNSKNLDTIIPRLVKI